MHYLWQPSKTGEESISVGFKKLMITILSSEHLDTDLGLQNNNNEKKVEFQVIAEVSDQQTAALGGGWGSLYGSKHWE